MAGERDIKVRMFGALRAFRRERGLPEETCVSVPEGGVPARQVATDLDLPLEAIEGIFCNHTIRPLSHVVRPGDEVAFVPYGTPGPHRYYLGLYKAGRGDE